jgi:predicted DNA-binding transcriptional regulator YafY
MNLVICLLVSRGYVGKSRIRKVVEGYREQTEDAFEKMFERDKEELREIGIPIELGHNDRLFDDEPGYRIRRDAFELPPIDLAPDEARPWAGGPGLAARQTGPADLNRGAQAEGRRCRGRHRGAHAGRAPVGRGRARIRAAVGRGGLPAPGVVSVPASRS